MELDGILERAVGLEEELISLRRDFHRHPEVAWEEARTAAVGREWLGSLGLEIRSGIAGSHGLTAALETGRPGPTLLLRADMDALPVSEESGAAYASENPGVMHACGHDAHMACLLGAAKLLVELREELSGRVLFLLQPAEEIPPGGARKLVEEGGLLKGVDAAVALHVTVGLPVGQVGFRPGIMLANAGRFELTITGSGGHAGMPHLTVDAIAVAAQVIQALQYLVSRENDPLEPAVISLGTIRGGTTSNVVADKVEITGTLRALDDELAAELPRKMERVIAGICQAARGGYHFSHDPGYPALYNDEELTAQAMDAARAVLGEEAVELLPRPQMGGEDFAYIARRVPSLFFRLGAGNPARGIVHPAHSSRFDIDEKALPVGVAALVGITLDYLKGGG